MDVCFVGYGVVETGRAPSEENSNDERGVMLGQRL